MYKLDTDKQCLIKNIVLGNLKMLGVRCRIPKKLKENEKENLYLPEYQIFQKPLHLLKMCSVSRLDGSSLEVPEFLVDACAAIERDIKTEGIFRRAGSACKQKKSKLLIDQGNKVSSDYHVFDACSLVKLFFRELPQPLIPHIYQEIILSCLLLSSQKKQVEALLLVCLLLPLENLQTLAFFMEFLLKVSKYSDVNKMSKKNLAIILTPTLMPAQKGRTSNNLDMTHHFKVFELLIEHSENIGIIPQHVEETLAKQKGKKKKRSGSLTRMFTGLKKIVGTKSISTPDCDDSGISTPGSIGSFSKRKMSGNVSSPMPKRKRETSSDVGLPTAAITCRMLGYANPHHINESVLPHNLRKANSGGSPSRNQKKNSRSFKHKEKNSDSNIFQRCLERSQKPMSSSSTSIGNLFSLGSQKSLSERRLSVISWGRKKTLSNLFLNRSEPEYQEEQSLENTVDASNDSDLITVHKSEYEDIKNRVLALEEEIQELNAAHSVQTAYEKTLEESEKINSSSTEHLARKLSKELKIRRSLENKVIRSPSARKIGSIRRRSKESLQRSIEQKSSLRRGRPNTLQSGLPSPNLRVDDKSISCTESVKNLPEEEEWQSGEQFFAREYLLPKLLTSSQGRPSLVEIRNQNAGMVLEKAKLFNALNQDVKEEKEGKIQKRHSVRIENLRRMKEMENDQKLTCESLKEVEQNEITFRKNGANHSGKKNLTSPRAFSRPGSAVNESSRTPVIKKPLCTRSPRLLGKTPVSQVKSNIRSRATPVRALLDPYGTPRVGFRRSPRILARSLTSPPRIKE